MYVDLGFCLSHIFFVLPLFVPLAVAIELDVLKKAVTLFPNWSWTKWCSILTNRAVCIDQSCIITFSLCACAVTSRRWSNVMYRAPTQYVRLPNQLLRHQNLEDIYAAWLATLINCDKRYDVLRFEMQTKNGWAYSICVNSDLRF